MSARIQLHVKEVYGVTKYYPVNKTAELICKLAKVKTLVPAQFEILEDLGYTIEKDRVEFTKE